MPKRQLAIPQKHRPSSPRWLPVVMLIATLLAGGRIAQLAVGSPEQGATASKESATSASSLQAIETGQVRLVAAEEPAAGDWLVDPKKWFVPEDKAGDQPDEADQPDKPAETKTPAEPPAPTKKPVELTPAPPSPLSVEPDAVPLPDDGPSLTPPQENAEPDLPPPAAEVPREGPTRPIDDPRLNEPLDVPGVEVPRWIDPLTPTDIPPPPAPLPPVGAPPELPAPKRTKPAPKVVAPPAAPEQDPVELQIEPPEAPAPPVPPVPPAPPEPETPVVEPPAVEAPEQLPSPRKPVAEPVPGPRATPPAAQPPVRTDPGTRRPNTPRPAAPRAVTPRAVQPPAAVPRPDWPAPGMQSSVLPGGLGSPHGDGHPAAPLTAEQQQKADLAHAELFAKNCYPSASECATCHKRQYEEWRVSSHAYAFVSPMFHKFEQTISGLSRGTVGYFCQRCHSPVGTAMGMNRATPLWQQPKVAREGVTCIACHRVNEQYGRNNGERRIVPGDITAPVYGGIGGSGVAKAIANKGQYKVKTSPQEPGAGQVIHNEGRFFQQLSHAEFCTSCHQVAVHPGIKLEVVWDQYRRSPACAEGVTCQDCHMGKKPGEPSGYDFGSIAEVGGKSVNTHRKRANHTFYGPSYSIAHPGVFPHNDKADRWRIDEWLLFDWRAGWGTDDFEDAVADGRINAAFPPVWNDTDDRYDAREIIEDNLKLIARKRETRQEVMEHSLKVAGPFFKHTPTRGNDLRLHYDVTNLNSGHNVLTASLGAQPQLWANVVLIGPDGRRLWETGYTDSDGDVADIHSRDVRAGRLPFDRQLFNLQTMFLITGATGTDRELPLPVNIDIDQVPLLRPGTIPVSVTNHPPFIRMESRSISPLGTKRVKYKIPGHLIRQPGRYRLTFRMRNRIEPIYFMRFCDATDEMVRAMNEGVLDIGLRSVEFWVR